MELSPVPPPLFDSVQTEGIDPVRQKGLDLCIRPTRAVVISKPFCATASIYSSFGGGMISTGLIKSRSDRSRKDMGTHECLFLSWRFGYFASSIFLLAFAKSATLFV
jgi:hypothetical protein